MLQLIDTHAHLDEIENLEQTITQAKATTENAKRLFGFGEKK